MLESKSLFIKPLTYEQVLKYLKCDMTLEAELELFEHPRTISIELKEAFKNTIIPNLQDSMSNQLLSTLWIAYTKSTLKIVGDACFYGNPNENGEIEIGYGTYNEFRNLGYMTEIIGKLSNWALTQANVKTVIAVTNKFNNPSFKVLIKNGFQLLDENEYVFTWKLENH